MVFLSEFVTYLIKYVALGLIALAGIMCGIKSAKKKKEAEAIVAETTETTK